MKILLLPTLTKHYKLAEYQHGFRKMHNTTTVLNVITTQTSEVLNQRRPCDSTVLVAVDLAKTFDTFNHTILG